MSYTAGILDGLHTQGIWSTATILGATHGRAFLLNTAAATIAWPANNDAYLIPFLVSTPVTFNRIVMQGGTTPGTSNFDLGVYDAGFNRLRSLGATAAVNATDGFNPVGGGSFSTPLTLTRGRYYMAMSAESTGLTVRANQSTNGVPRALGMFKMATAHPLPATFTPASMGTTAMVPNIALLTSLATIL